MSGGSVCLIADQSARYILFFQSLTGLFANLPPGTVVDWEIGADRGRSRNNLVERALERGSEWVFFLDDDHTYPPTVLDVLLSRNMPVVAALYLQRTDPFLPIAYAERDENGNYWPLDLSVCPEHGLVTVAAAGTGGMLIKAEVFKEIEGPWFVHTTAQSEDLHFCNLLIDAGIQLYVDLDARLGHVMPISIYPDYEDGQWAAGMATSPSMKVLLPINMPLQEDEPAGDPDRFILPEDVQEPGPETSAPGVTATPAENGASAEGNGADTGAVATRVEMYPDDDGRWHARGVTEDGTIVAEQRATFDRESAEMQARQRWPGLDIYEVPDATFDSTWDGIGQARDSARGKMKRMYGNR